MVPDGWCTEELAGIVTFKSGGTPSKGNVDYWGGEIPWVSAKDLKSFYLKDSVLMITQKGSTKGTRIVPGRTILILVRGMTLRKDVPVAITTRPMAFNQDVKALLPKGVNPEFLGYYLVSKKAKLMTLVSEAGHGTGRLQTDLLMEFPVLLPPATEQSGIAESLKMWDHAIDLTERLLAEKQERRKGLMQRLLTGKKRLPGFARSTEVKEKKWMTIPVDWKYPQFAEIAEHVSAKNNSGKDQPVLSCTKHKGLVDSLQYFGKKIYSDDLSPYKIVRRGQFAYATNHIEEGSIGYQDLYDEAVVSPMYTVFQAGDMVVDRYLFLLLKTELYRHIFEANTSSSVNRRGSLRWKDFSRIHVPLPLPEEQEAILKVFDTVDRELGLLEQKLDALKEQKKGLMQQLLTGKIRVKLNS